MDRLLLRIAPRELYRILRTVAIAPLTALIDKVLLDYGLRASRSAIEGIRNKVAGKDGHFTEGDINSLELETTSTSFQDSADTAVRSDGSQQVSTFTGDPPPSDTPDGAYG